MACFAKFFGRKHGSFNLPVAGTGDGVVVATRVTRRLDDGTELINQMPPSSLANGNAVKKKGEGPAGEEAAPSTLVKSTERESGLGSMDERLHVSDSVTNGTNGGSDRFGPIEEPWIKATITTTSATATATTTASEPRVRPDAVTAPGPTIERKASRPRSDEHVKISLSSRETSTMETPSTHGMLLKDLLQNKILHMLALQSKGSREMTKSERSLLAQLEREIPELQRQVQQQNSALALAAKSVQEHSQPDGQSHDGRASSSSQDTNLTITVASGTNGETGRAVLDRSMGQSEQQLLDGELSDYDVITTRKPQDETVSEAPSSEDERSAIMPPDLPPRASRGAMVEEADDTSQDEEPTPPKLPPPRSQLEQSLLDEVISRTLQESMVRQAASASAREGDEVIPLPTVPPPSRDPPPPAPDQRQDEEPTTPTTPAPDAPSVKQRPDDVSTQRSLIEELDSTIGTLKKARKQGVVSDKTDLKESKDIVIPTHPKSAETELLIKAAIVANDFLNNMMDEERLLAVTAAMSSMSFPPNSYIIKEGDIGAHFYVSEEGTYEVVVDNKVIKSFGRGVVFGELAILYKAKRFASIRVTSGAKVWLLERKVFQKIMMKSGRKEREENVRFLSTVSVLKDLEIEKLHKISDLLKREFYATGSTIIQQGDPGDKFYIIRGGSVNVIKTDKRGNDRLVGTLQRGAYFGEQALLHEDRRLASIIANPPGTECLTLNRIAFNEFLGGLDTLREVKLSDTIPRSSTMTNIVSEYDHIQLHDLTYIGTLGIGGFGRVELVAYKNRQTFALKYLKKIEMVRQQQQEHAYSEKDIMLSCNSPFIVRLYKTYRDKKYLYFLMEACLGGDVWTVLQKSKFFDERTARFITGCVVEAFEYLHSRNMIYRDLKPENLMLDDKGYIKLVDFGFAKRIGPNQKTWTFAGTPEYVSPEIILNKGHDRAVDYWALGVLIHELLVGKPPFRGKNHMKTYNAILRGIDIIELPSRVPKKAQVLIKRLCRQTAAERLGYGKNGIADIKNHPWFGSFEWQRLKERTMPAPLIRPIQSDIDLSNFDEYPKDQDEPPDETSGWDINF
ncbi:cGMP-dependent protein kinase 1-like isoform X1 [Anopheles albimanus]|uniref:cGMP-dependent protein kinase n=1 Tax=Anopheles albimanus TaxID=7167 RepID=A0A182F2Y8_ANOAL|nr:cGMP-dependent protein kinase 1-like isoform X1 [Anopheles albimanus]